MANPLKVSEASFQSQVIHLAQLYDWRVMHTRPAQVRSGRWVTPLTGSAGFPDLILCRPFEGDLIAAELKSSTGTLSDGQKVWLDHLSRAGIETYVWRPKDLPFIKSRLARSPNHDHE